MSFAEYYGFRDKYQQTGTEVKARILEDLLQYADRAINLAESEEVKNFYIEKTQSYRDFIAAAPQYVEEETKVAVKKYVVSKIILVAVIAVVVIFIFGNIIR